MCRDFLHNYNPLRYNVPNKVISDIKVLNSLMVHLILCEMYCTLAVTKHCYLILYQPKITHQTL